MSKKEEITDLISDKGIHEIKVGTVLKFEYEGSPIYIRVTRKITKPKPRMWGEHINELVDFETGMSHYGHNIDITDEAREMTGGVPYCQDCEVPIRELANEAGDDAAAERQAREENDE